MSEEKDSQNYKELLHKHQVALVEIEELKKRIALYEQTQADLINQSVSESSYQSLEEQLQAVIENLSVSANMLEAVELMAKAADNKPIIAAVKAMKESVQRQVEWWNND